MQIKLLGTGAAEGWPGLFCKCDACLQARKLGGKNLRSRASALIDGILKIDFPPDTLHHVLTQCLDLTKVQHLLFTHGHDDHFAVRELQYMSWMFVPEPITQILHVVCPADVAREMKLALNLGVVPIAIECIAPWETLGFSDFSVTAVKAQHDPERMCLNYLISRGGTTLLYATDTGWYEEPTWKFLAGFRLDGVVMECTKGMDEGGYKAHMSIPELIRVRVRLIDSGILGSESPFVTTHHSHLGGLLHEELEYHLNPHGIAVGYDGFAFEI